MKKIILIYAIFLLIIGASVYIILKTPKNIGLAHDILQPVNQTIDLNINTETRLNQPIELKRSNIKSITLSGNISYGGNAKIYIEKDDKRYLLFDSQSLQKPVNTELSDQIPNNNININLEYKKDSLYDENNDGIESTKGIIDLTIENSQILTEFKEDKLCSIWTVNNNKKICYGNKGCCNFADLESSRDLWNETFYLYYSSYEATTNNIIEAQILHLDYSIDPKNPYANVFSSEKVTLPALFIPPYQLVNVCEETCSLPNLPKGSYNLIVENNGTELFIDSISYSGN